MPITSREELEKWLEDKPADWARVLATRAALRALPFELGRLKHEKGFDGDCLDLFRAIVISWIQLNYSEIDSKKTTLAALDAVSARNYGIGSFAVDILSAAAYGAVPFSVSFVALTAKLAADSAPLSKSDARAVKSIHSKVGRYARLRVSVEAADNKETVWANLTHDCNRLLDNHSMLSGSNLLTNEQLCPKGVSHNWRNMRAVAKRRLLDLDEGYEVWIIWFDRRLDGERAAFDIAGDTDRAEEKEILFRLAEATDVDFWGKGALYVNTTLQRWIDEARERAASKLPDAETRPADVVIRAVAAEVASPTVTLTNGQLDVIANADFDQLTDATNLDEAVAILRAVVAALVKSLDKALAINHNIPPTFAANLSIYEETLARSGDKLFVGVLERMEKAVNALFHAEFGLFDKGANTNFESFFTAHRDFLEYYARNKEREAKIAQFKVDEGAASGEALVEPFRAAADEAEALAEQGLVTPNLVAAFREQQMIVEAMAFSTSSVPIVTGEPSPKTRSLLQAVGIFERSLTNLTNIVSVTTQFAAFILILKAGIEALLKFFV